MEAISLPRTGTAKLSFQGELIAEASSKRHQGPAENRWFELAVYRRENYEISPDGKIICSYVIAIGFRTCWQGELDRDFAEPRGDADSVRTAFESFDPCDPALWRGIPENVHDAERRNSYYRDAIGAAYRAAVSELLQSYEFAEVLA